MADAGTHPGQPHLLHGPPRTETPEPAASARAPVQHSARTGGYRRRTSAARLASASDDTICDIAPHRAITVLSHGMKKITLQADHVGRFYAGAAGAFHRWSAEYRLPAGLRPAGPDHHELSEALLASHTEIANALDLLGTSTLIRRSRAAGQRMDRVRLDFLPRSPIARLRRLDTSSWAIWPARAFRLWARRRPGRQRTTCWRWPPSPTSWSSGTAHVAAGLGSSTARVCAPRASCRDR